MPRWRPTPSTLGGKRSSSLVAVDHVLHVVDVLPRQLQDLADVVMLSHLCNSIIYVLTAVLLGCVASRYVTG